MQVFTQFFSDEMLFDSISTYLTISDLLSLCQVNRLLNQIVQQKCKRMIKAHKLSLVPFKTGIHQMRFYFDRCLTIYRKREQAQEQKHEKVAKQRQRQQKQLMSNIDKNSTYNIDKNSTYNIDKNSTYNIDKNSTYNIDKNSTYNIQVTIQNPFKFKTITYFQVGVQYSVYLTIQKDAYIFKTSSLTNFKQKKEGQLKHQKRTNISQIRCKSENITYLTQNGQVYQIFGDKTTDNTYQKQQQLQWCQYIQIQSIQASFNYTVFKPKSNNIRYEQFLKYVFGYEIDLQKLGNAEISKNQDKGVVQGQKDSQKTTLVLLNNITFKYYLVQFDRKQEIIQMAVGNKQAYLLNEQYQCFVCYFEQQVVAMENFNNQQNKVVKAKIFYHLADKTIIKLASGYNFFVALERKIHDVSKWTVEQVCKWVRQIDFGQFAKIINAQKVDGKKLLTIDKNYMYSSLGITKPNMQQKFIMLLQEVIENKNKQDTLYGWGKNQNGQLGSRNSNFIKQPQRIKPPTCIKQSEHIDSIFCGWYQTFIRTQKGRVYRTVNCQKKKKQKEQTFAQNKGADKNGLNVAKHSNQSKKGYVDFQDGYDSERQYEQTKNTKKNDKNDKGHNKKRRKYTQDQLKRDYHHKKFQEQQKWIQCELGKAFFVQGYKDILLYIQCPSQKQFQPTKQIKLRTVKTLLNKITWSVSPQQKQTYKVGYMDKDMGLIQTTILELKTFQYNEKRIKYIKRGSQIVWDRQNKMDIFG